MLDRLKQELTQLGIILVGSIILFKLIFLNEPLGSIIRIILSIFYIFIIPGYLMLYYWNAKIEFIERTVLGIALSGAILGVVSYYIALIGLNVNFHFILPLLLILAGFYIALIKTPHPQPK